MEGVPGSCREVAYLSRLNLVYKAKETVGLGQTPVTEAAKGEQPLDREKAFDALGVSVVEEYGEWKPDGAPLHPSAG